MHSLNFNRQPGPGLIEGIKEGIKHIVEEARMTGHMASEPRQTTGQD